MVLTFYVLNCQVIVVDFSNLHRILRQGSALYRKYHLSLSEHHSCEIPSAISETTAAIFTNAVKTLNVMDLLDNNTALRKLTAVQKRHLECLVEGPVVYTPGQRLWRSGSTVDKAFIVVAGTVSFVPKRRTGTNRLKLQHRLKQAHETKPNTSQENMGTDLGNSMRQDSMQAIREVLAVRDFNSVIFLMQFTCSFSCVFSYPIRTFSIPKTTFPKMNLKSEQMNLLSRHRH